MPLQPPVGIGRLALHVGLHLGVGQDQEPAVADRLGDHLGDVLGLDDAVGAAVAELPGRHGRVHALRAQHRHADAVVAVGDGDASRPA